jgi:hypothetical protein
MPEDKGKILEEAINWEPTFGQRTRPKKLWEAIMEEPWVKEEKDDTTSKEV